MRAVQVGSRLSTEMLECHPPGALLPGHGIPPRASNPWRDASLRQGDCVLAGFQNGAGGKSPKIGKRTIGGGGSGAREPSKREQK